VAAGERPNPYGRTLTELVTASAAYARWQVLGDMGAMAMRTVRIAARPPFSWFREAVSQVSIMARQTAVPLTVCHIAYMVGFGTLLFGNLISDLGVSERVGGFLWVAWVREVATWITAMVFAGVVGSAIAADLGARKIREELDAINVLGVDHVATLMIPRIIAATVALPLLAVLCQALATAVNLLLAPSMFGTPSAVVVDNLASTIQHPDLLFPLLLKNACLGFLVGLVACVKGVTAPGGAEGVGRAVNQTVVITFFSIWLFDSAFNIGYLTLMPDVSLLRG
jgi:phospholipid/cholesterol/gamma-HCH transport system permease protein